MTALIVLLGAAILAGLWLVDQSIDFLMFR
jgi:hypothetical protein